MAYPPSHSEAAPSSAPASAAAGRRPVDVFLCHNSRDKPLVRQVAEGLELEFGVPHFLDMYAIPTGEAFLPWIENALATSSGCAIFLGANGWGETHFWEAERALDRYRQDPRFRLIPVALPGIREDDMKRLGAGSLFSQINWADFRSGTVDPNAISKLKAALQGQAPEGTRGPARLTPYLVRRDATRWEESGRRDKSILYRGRQLTEAQALRVAQPDLVSGNAIVGFLSASEAAQTSRFRQLAIASMVALLVIAALALQADSARRLALSRFVASEARQAPSPDTGILLAAQATQISDTPEAFGALLERLDAQPHLRHMIRVGEVEVLSLAFEPMGSALYAGQADGRIVRLDLQTMKQTLITPGSGSAVIALEIEADTNDVWASTQDGRVVVYGASGTVQLVKLPAAAADSAPASSTAPLRGKPILSLQIDPQRRWVAIGDHQHRLMVLDRASRTLLWSKTLAAQRITAVSFSADGEQLAAASSEGLIEVFEPRTGQLIRTFSTARTGNPIAVQFARNGDLRVMDDGNGYSIFASGNGARAFRRLPGGGLSAAAVGPRREFGPVQRRDLSIRGFGTGDVSLTPLQSDTEPLLVRGHARSVHAAALSFDGGLAATGAGDGTIAVWDLQQRSRLFERRPPAGGESVALVHNEHNGLVAVTTSDESALVSRLSPQGWIRTADLMALTAAAAGQPAVTQAAAQPDAQGFVPVPDNVLMHAAFSQAGLHLAWATRTGAVLWAPMPLTAGVRTVHQAKGPIDAMALSDSGRHVYVAEEGSALLRLDTSASSEPPKRRRLAASVRYMVAGGSDDAVIVALEDGTVRRIEFSGTEPSETWQLKLPGTAGQLARAPGGHTLVSAGAGSSAGIDIGVIDGSTYQRLHSRRVGGAVSSIALSSRAKLIAAVDHDGRLHFWDLASLVPIASLQVSDDALNGLAMSGDGQHLVVSSVGGDLFELRLDKARWLDGACAMVRRDLSISEWTALVPDSKPETVCEGRLRP